MPSIAALGKSVGAILNTARSASDGRNTCILLTTPGEIRNEIYKLCLTSDQPLDITPHNIRARTALLQVNKQVRSEAEKFFYSENSFPLKYLSPGDGHLALTWLEGVGKQRAATIPKLFIRFERHEYELRRGETFQDTNDPNHPILLPIDASMLSIFDSRRAQGVYGLRIALRALGVRPNVVWAHLERSKSTADRNALPSNREIWIGLCKENKCLFIATVLIVCHLLAGLVIVVLHGLPA